MGFYEWIGSQFSNPRGIPGKICCKVMNGMNRSMYENVAAALPLNSAAKVLDIGCGNGYLIQKMCRKSKGHFYGMDLSRDTLKSAYKRNRKGILKKKVKLALGDCCDIPYEASFFDAVTSVNTIYFWKDTGKGFAEIHRVLKPGGLFCNAFYSKAFLQRLKYTRVGFQYFEPEEIGVLANQAGFSKVSVKNISGGKGFLIRCLKARTEEISSSRER